MAANRPIIEANNMVRFRNTMASFNFQYSGNYYFYNIHSVCKLLFSHCSTILVTNLSFYFNPFFTNLFSFSIVSRFDQCYVLVLRFLISTIRFVTFHVYSVWIIEWWMYSECISCFNYLLNTSQLGCIW